MILRKGSLFIGAALSLVLLSAQAQAHWCDDLWASSYNIVVKPDSDTSPQNIYVQNNMGYQLINFKLTATGTGGAITLTAPTTLKVSGTLLPGEKGIWKIASGSPAKIEDVTFAVSFGNSGQSGLYPSKDAKAVMVVKTDGALHPAAPLPGMANSLLPSDSRAQQARSLQYSSVADFEDLNTGLDKLMTLYCAGRGSFGSTDGVSMTYCKDASSTTCPTSKPSAGTGSKFDYMHLWSAGELAVRKASLGTRLPVLRQRLQCGINDGEMSFAGYATFVLGYLGNDATAKTFLQSQAAAGGDLGTISKAALYMMGDTAQKADVQAGLKASSVFVQAACAGAIGIVDKDDATVSSVLIPLVKWTEPDLPGGDGGKGMVPAHILEIVAFDRRGWVAKGVGTGAVGFYGETGSTPGTGGNAGGTGGATGAGGAVGSGGATGNRDASPVDVRAGTSDASGNGGAIGSGGRAGSGGAAGSGSATGSGGRGGSGGSTSAAGATGAAGATSVGGAIGGGGATASAGGTTGVAAGGDVGGNGGANGTGGDTGSGTAPASAESTGCSCNLGRGTQGTPTLSILAVAGLAWLFGRRRRR